VMPLMPISDEPDQHYDKQESEPAQIGWHDNLTKGV
jgi:hypothetical protein